MTLAPIVFIGPSLSMGRAREVLPESIFAGPAKCGDVYRAAQLRPPAIALIDGYFDHQLSVWHKEVLWAIHQGIPVYGAASMGALRAAELADCGMIGVGAVFELFRAGVLEDDDEVAVLHAPIERDHAPLSDAMVNIRATLRAAVLDGIIDSGDEARLIAAGKRLYYPDRSLTALMRDEALLSSDRRTRFREWLQSHGLVDLKGQDSLLLLRRLGDDLAAGVPAPVATSPFAHTSYWEVLRSSLDRMPEAGATRVLGPEEPRVEVPDVPSCPSAAKPPILETLEREDPAAYWRLQALSAHAALALLLAKQRGERVTEKEAQVESERFRIARQLLTPEQTIQWLDARGIDLVGFSSLIQNRILTARVTSHAQTLIDVQLIDLLKSMGPSP